MAPTFFLLSANHIPITSIYWHYDYVVVYNKDGFQTAGNQIFFF